MMWFYGYYNGRVRARVKLNKEKFKHSSFIHYNNEENQGEWSKGKIRKQEIKLLRSSAVLTFLITEVKVSEQVEKLDLSNIGTVIYNDCIRRYDTYTKWKFIGEN